MLSLTKHSAVEGFSTAQIEPSAAAFTENGYIRDLRREVYGIFGIPVDRLELESVISEIEAAALVGAPFILSTPNLQFLVLNQVDATFRESILQSDLCTADGMPLVWLARLLGAPIKNRIAGSDMFDVLKARQTARRPLKVFLFGGPDGAAHFVAKRINSQSKSLICVGAMSPGFGTIEEMSSPTIVDEINASGADFLAIFMSAPKGQQWLLRNHDRLTVPIRSHLGATINFQAGTIRRAPLILRRMGLEWLWRIKEEPYLWRRYFRDGRALLKLVIFRALPLFLYKAFRSPDRTRFGAWRTEIDLGTKIEVHGAAVRANVPLMIPVIADAMTASKDVVVDLSFASTIDSRFFGLLVMLRKVLKQQDRELRIIAPTRRIRRLFRLNAFEFLLETP